MASVEEELDRESKGREVRPEVPGGRTQSESSTERKELHDDDVVHEHAEIIEDIDRMLVSTRRN